MRATLLFFGVSVAFAGCGAGSEVRPPARPVAAAPASRVPPARCPAAIDPTLAREVLTRHARAYGSAEQVAASLPITLAGTATIEGRVGRLDTAVTAEAHRSQLFVAGILSANGVDPNGAWTLDGGSGVVEYLSRAEGVDAVVDAWLLRHGFLAASGAELKVRCEDLPTGGARVDLAFTRPDLGSPTLAFDLETAALLSVVHQQPDGRATTTTFEAWTDPDHGVRWPRKSTERPVVGSAITIEVTSVVHGLECSRIDPSGVALPERGAACAAPPPDRFVLQWPPPDALGRTLVRLPFAYLGGEILVRAKLGGREVTAFLDSGAGVTAVDASTPAGAHFKPSMEMTGAGSTQKVRLGFGELPTIDLGDLHAQHVPAVSVPIPALDAFGDKRPELILGCSFFASTVIRVDYKHLEIVIAKSTAGLFAKGNEPRAVPLRLLRSKLIVDGSVEGVPAQFEVDTGNSGGLDLYKKWAFAHDLPGARPVATMKGRFGVGTAETTSSFFRLAKASLGPITFDDRISHVADPPGTGIVAGLAGNEVLARCEAVVFDVRQRALWLEGPCDRPVPERRVGWRFEKKADPAYLDRPWVVNALWPDGPAERAGIRLGDRVLEMGGKPATADVAVLWALEQQPAGTKLPIVVSRARTKERIVVELRTLTP